MASETELIISRFGFPPFSARNCHQQLLPLRGGEFRRTINGKLHYLGRPTHQKFKTVISCDDKATLAFDQFWLGADLMVSCIQSLWQEVIVGPDAVRLLRPAVADSVITQHKHQLETPTTLRIQAKQGTKVMVRYNPILQMRVTHFSMDTQEWSGKSSWVLELEEI
jgi:hypothetical protein